MNSVRNRRDGSPLFALSLSAFLFAVGCSIDLNERLELCPGNALVESVHCLASERMLRPAIGHEWRDMVREPFQEYGRPPITMQDLERRYGAPAQSWEDKGRPFAEYALPGGILRFGLEEEKSGSYAYQAWRLRWRPHSMGLSQILEKSAVECLSKLLQPDTEVLLLGRENNIPRMSIRLDELEVREVIWLNLDTDAMAHQ
jgi:hypothetical protein